MTIQVSVVVPTYKRPDLLSRCLAALLAQDFDPTVYEIIVADDAASDDTRHLVESLAKDGYPALRYVPVTHAHGPAAARNAGWQAARGEIIAFTDDDCIPDPGWLKAGVATFVDGAIGAWGRIIMPLPDVPTDYERDAAGLTRSQFVTANCFYRRDALVSVGGFDERFKVPWREDSDLYFSLLKHVRANGHLGQQFVHVPDAIVVHPVRPAPWGVSLRQQRKNMFNALLYKKHAELYRQKVQPAPPWRYYGIIGAVLAALIGLMSGRRRLALSAASLWALMTGLFCMRRLHSTSRAPYHIAEMMVTSALIPPLAVFWRIRGAIKFHVFFL